MAISISVTVTCDGRRVSGCHWSYDLGANPAPAAVARKWREADELGWTIWREDGTELHLCPVCSGAWLAGADVLPPPVEATPPSETGVGGCKSPAAEALPRGTR